MGDSQPQPLDHKAMAEFWPTVNAGHRHIVDAMPRAKRERLMDRFWDNFLDILPDDYFPEVAWDWGCGGGLLADMLVKHAMDVVLLDVSADSLTHAKQHVGDFSVLRTVQLDSLDQDWARLPKPDVLICYNVIHHFPGLAYLKSVVEIWKRVAPAWIGVSAKVGDHHEAANYHEDYVHGLVLPTEDLRQLFEPEYQIMHYGHTRTQQGEHLAHLTFRRKV